MAIKASALGFRSVNKRCCSDKKAGSQIAVEADVFLTDFLADPAEAFGLVLFFAVLVEVFLDLALDRAVFLGIAGNKVLCNRLARVWVILVLLVNNCVSQAEVDPESFRF